MRSILPKPPLRVVFVGNSLTEYNGGVDRHLRLLLQAADKWNAPAFATVAVTRAGAYLHEQVAPLREFLERGLPWDAVVLQGYSDEPGNEDPAVAERFEESVRQLDAIVRDARSRPVLFMTWGYRGRADMGRRVASSYLRAGEALHVPVVPVGLAFERSGRELPALALIADDARHPTPAGTYLAACVFFAAFEGRTPEGNTYIAGLDPATARSLQGLAWRSAREFYGWTHPVVSP
ncbi:MAG: hypothetical protein ACM3SO_11990 [Betaproteobacteria bacterium]